MPNWLSGILKIAVFCCGVVVLAFGITTATRWHSNEVTIQSLSPDERYRIALVERSPNLPLRIDRNFRVMLTTLSEFKSELATEILFDSPDEGRPIGSEQFVWSKDSNYVLLIGRHFGVNQELPVGNGDQAYFLCHLPSKRCWFNAAGRRTDADERLSEDQLHGIEFAVPKGGW